MPFCLRLNTLVSCFWIRDDFVSPLFEQDPAKPPAKTSLSGHFISEPLARWAEQLPTELSSGSHQPLYPAGFWVSSLHPRTGSHGTRCSSQSKEVQWNAWLALSHQWETRRQRRFLLDHHKNRFHCFLFSCLSLNRVHQTQGTEERATGVTHSALKPAPCSAKHSSVACAVGPLWDKQETQWMKNKEGGEGGKLKTERKTEQTPLSCRR